MATRVVEGKKPYTGGKAISIDENKVISLNLRDENNLIIYDAGDDEIYVDLQLDDEITPTSAFPIGVNVGRVIVDNGWDKPGTIISAETTSGDNIKIFYADEGTLWIDNGTGTFKQIYFKADVDALLLALRNYIDGELAKKQNGVSSDTAPSNPSEGDLWYDTTNNAMKVWDGTAWQSVGTGGGGSDIEYVTQVEYNALLPGALTDNKHYFIYSTSGGGGWQPGANTIGYRPLVSDLKDYSGNGYDLSYNGTVFYSQVGNATKNSYTSTGGSNMLYSTSVAGVPQGTNVSTQSCWFYLASNPQSGHDGTVFAIGTTNNNEIRTMFINGGSSTIKLSQWGSASSGYGLSLNTWYNIIMVYDGSAFKLYLNGNSSPVISWNYNVSTNGTNVYIMGDGNFGPYGTVGNMSNVILENKVWTTQEISDYFDLTKGDYGIS